jgi:hypothetical protein
MSTNTPEIVRLCRNTGAERLQQRQKYAKVGAFVSTGMSQGNGPNL